MDAACGGKASDYSFKTKFMLVWWRMCVMVMRAGLSETVVLG